MQSKRAVSLKYLELLEQGNTKPLLALFAENALIDSPVYGKMKAANFYSILSNDTLLSELHLKGIFEEENTNKLALYFEYKWTMKNNTQVVFDVVDIIEFNETNQIVALKIIYDTVISRELVKQLK